MKAIDSLVVAAVLLAVGGAGRADAQGLPTCARAAVLVTVDGGTGSGTMIDPRGLVLTNHHVVAPVLVPGFEAPIVRGGAHVRVLVPDARTLDATSAFEATILDSDPELDLALLRITTTDAPTFDAIPIADGDALSIGESVQVLGYPFGHRILTVLSGRVTGRRQQTDGQVDWLTVDAPFNPGNSGGTVVDARCRLVGVPTQVYRGGLNPVNMARPVDARLRSWVESTLGRSTTPSAAPIEFGDDAPAAGTKPPAARTSRRRARR